MRCAPFGFSKRPLIVNGLHVFVSCYLGNLFGGSSTISKCLNRSLSTTVVCFVL